VTEQCEFVKPDGTRCRGRAYGGPYCNFHRPENAGKQQEARSAGGKAVRRRAAVLAELPDDTPLATTKDVTTFLATVARKTARGELDAKIANSVTQTCAVLLRGLEPGEGEELKRRLQKVEGQADVFSRVAEFAEALRHLRGDGHANGTGHADGGGVPPGAVPGQRLRELLDAPAADGAAGAVPVP
jgi:hypothetical protein